MSAVNENTVGFFISVVVLACVGAWWIRGRLQLRNARSWPAALATIEATDMRIEPRGNGQSMHVARVTYAYVAMGGNHSGTWKRQSILYGKLKKWVDGNAVGNKIWIRYDPKKAMVSVVLTADQGLPKTA